MNNGLPFHIAALLYRNGKLISIQANGNSYDRRFFRIYKDGRAFCAHAEMAALTSSRPGDKLVVIRWTKDGQLAMAKPCRWCQKHIKRARLLNVRYTNINGQWEFL